MRVGRIEGGFVVCKCGKRQFTRGAALRSAGDAPTGAALFGQIIADGNGKHDNGCINGINQYVICIEMQSAWGEISGRTKRFEGAVDLGLRCGQQLDEDWNGLVIG